ncbi:type III effector protein [Streptomyces lydicus]|uniref:type III effector protein n=1 Tax=Streptomyces lydicus TaxID=47763 RepID=UPI00379EAEDA
MSDLEHSPESAPISLRAAESALRTVDEALRTARTTRSADRSGAGAAGPEEALAALSLLGEVRRQLAGWETGLIETARAAGASWADLAAALGVASRQAAERRYLRLRPGPAGTTGEQRVKAARDRRAADRSVTAWARHHAADLRGLAARITALTDLPAAAHHPVEQLGTALAGDDAAGLVGPLAAVLPHLRRRHAALAARVEELTRHTDRVRQDSDDQRHTR